MIFLSTDKVSQEVKKQSLDTPSLKSRFPLKAEEQADPDEATVGTQDSSLPDAQWHRSKTARFSQY